MLPHVHSAAWWIHSHAPAPATNCTLSAVHEGVPRYPTITPPTPSNYVQLVQYSAVLFMVVDVQEVDTKVFERYLLPLMQRRGFEGWYANKAGQVSEGSALFFRTSLFELVATCAAPPVATPVWGLGQNILAELHHHHPCRRCIWVHLLLVSGGATAVFVCFLVFWFCVVCWR